MKFGPTAASVPQWMHCRPARPMTGAGRDRDPLPHLERDFVATVDVYEQAPFDDVEEFVLVVVLVPPILAVNDTQADNAIVDAAQGLVVPGPRVGVRQLTDIEALDRPVFDIQECSPRIV